MSSIHIIYASTSGHTEYVVNVLTAVLRQHGHAVTLTRAEAAKPENLQKGDVLLLGSGTWNTGGTEGQLNPHMHALLFERATNVSLQGKRVGLISLGDERYSLSHDIGHIRMLEEAEDSRNVFLE
ncbi:flavodoxin family protein [Candidatus Peregrinibacteria bacterium]|nr:flavodoxin family protein [Candidatus Peregrinibacteria bacterium]